MAKYFHKVNAKLQDVTTGVKAWWSIVKGLYGEKVQSTVSTLIEGVRQVTNAREKAEILNEYFCDQSKVDDRFASLPRDSSFFQNNAFLSNVFTTEREVYNLLKTVDVCKACGPDGIGNRILKLCSGGIASSFSKLVNISLSSGVFPCQWKFANVILLFKKDDRQCKFNYRPVSLLCSLSKILEKIVFIRLYNFLLEIGYLNRLQSGFRPGDSTVNQLIYLVHQIYQAVEDGKEVRMVFLDISKAFDKVWHKGLLYKLKSAGIRGALLSWFESYLSNHQQRVVLDGQSSDWRQVEAGVPRGSVLGPLLFLIYINDITDEIQSKCLLYADDTSLFEVVDSPGNTALMLNKDLESIQRWATKWLVTINPSKTECMTFSSKRVRPLHPDLFYNGNNITEVSSHTHLGITLSSNLTWRAHIFSVYQKASKRLNMLKGIRYKVGRDTLRKLYKSVIRPVMAYADVLWDGCTDEGSELLESVQYEAGKVVTGAMRGTSRFRLMTELGWEDMKVRRDIHKLICYFKIVKNLSPPYLKDLLLARICERTHFTLRSTQNFTLFPVRTERFKRSFFPSTTKLWNDIDLEIRESDSIGSFKRALVNYFNIPKYFSPFDYALDRYSSVIHTRLRLGACGLNYYLFKIDVKSSPICSCGFDNETITHFFLQCPNYAALRSDLLAAAARIASGQYSDQQKVEVFLFGSSNMSNNENV